MGEKSNNRGSNPPASRKRRALQRAARHGTRTPDRAARPAWYWRAEARPGRGARDRCFCYCFCSVPPLSRKQKAGACFVAPVVGRPCVCVCVQGRGKESVVDLLAFDESKGRSRARSKPKRGRRVFEAIVNTFDLDTNRKGGLWRARRMAGLRPRARARAREPSPKQKKQPLFADARAVPRSPPKISLHGGGGATREAPPLRPIITRPSAAP